MADLKISDAPEIPKEQLQDGTKIPTGGFGNYSVSVNTIRDWLVTYKDIATATSVSTVETNLSLHEANLLNPHQVTKSQVGLSNVDNTSDLSKPISTSTQAALDLKSDKSTTYTKTETNTLLNDKSDKIYTYSKNEVNTLLNLKQEKLSVDGTLDVISSYDLIPSLDGIDGLPSSTMNQQAQALGNRDEYLNTVKADKATTASGYGITDVYTKTEVYSKTESDNIFIENSEKDVANGVATLDANAKVKPTLLPINNSLTSTSSNEVLAAAQGKILNDQAFGVGQTWQDVKSSRSIGTTYTNTSGKTILVSMTAITGTSTTVIYGRINGVSVKNNTYSANAWASMDLLVPNGANYLFGVESPGTAALQYWNELR